ncbi:MAG: dioxygenase [Pseudomonadota bacterium]
MNIHSKPSALISKEADVTPFVKAAMSNTNDQRLRSIMDSMVSHLHAFLLDVRPTEEEFEAVLRWIVAVGQATNDSHNEAVLAADVVGASTLIDLINNDGMQGETMSALLGPFYRGEAPICENGDCIARGDTPGAKLIVSGKVLDCDGNSIAGAALDVWQASPSGMYENQDPDQPEMNLRGKFTTGEDGTYEFETVKPKGYPVPTDGPVGELLRAQNRTPMRPAHIHFIVSAPECKTLITQIFADTEEMMINDVVFGAKQQIAGDLREKADGTFTCEYDFVLKPGVPTFPVPPIKGKADA